MLSNTILFEISVVLFDLFLGHEAREFGDFELPGTDIDDFVAVLVPEAVLGTVLTESGDGALRVWAFCLSTTTMQAGTVVP